MSRTYNFKSRLSRQGIEKDRRTNELRRCGGSCEEEEEKERIADEMLRAAASETCAPTKAEMQLTRQTRGKCVIRLDTLADYFASIRPEQCWVDELKFLMKLTPLTRRERYFMRGWMLGWTQQQTSDNWMKQLGAEQRGAVCRVLKRAMQKCAENSAITFSAFSRHAIYRRPSRRTNFSEMSVCRHCKEPFVSMLGDGPYCSTGCRYAYGRLE